MEGRTEAAADDGVEEAESEDGGGNGEDEVTNDADEVVDRTDEAGDNVDKAAETEVVDNGDFTNDGATDKLNNRDGD